MRKGLFDFDHPPLVPPGAAGVDRAPVMLAFGGGLNSAAMVLGMFERGERADAVLFADTGGEKPDTYQFLFRFDDWMARNGFAVSPDVWHRPPGYEGLGLPESRALSCLQVCRSTGKYLTLEQNCLEKKLLPALAYGGRSCSEKYKQRPQHRWAKAWGPARGWWQLTEAGRRRKPKTREDEALLCRNVVKLIGYDANETHRGGGNVRGDAFYDYRYPLVEWGWERADCASACERLGVAPPGKSACFFCPASKPPELIELGLRYPKLMGRALAIEEAARSTGTMKVKGLSRWWGWKEFMASQVEKPFTRTEVCVCHAEVWEGEGVDGEEDDAAWPDDPDNLPRKEPEWEIALRQAKGDQ